MKSRCIVQRNEKVDVLYSQEALLLDTGNT